VQAEYNSVGMSSGVVFTVGHSTHPWGEFLEILQGHSIAAIADVRMFPGSRRFPHFNAEAMKFALPEAGVEYLPFRSLGVRRKAVENSVNTGWRNAMFRGYADFMQTPEFAEALAELQKAAAQRRTAIMCSEAVPWRCHRSLISDALLARGWEVMDIFDARTAKPHLLTPFAVVSGNQIVYPLPA
jgi:uncharacterized protein (DUF488 family)